MMPMQVAEEIFNLSIEAQRIDNKKWQIRKQLSGGEHVTKSWDELMVQAMQTIMEAKNVNA